MFGYLNERPRILSAAETESPGMGQRAYVVNVEPKVPVNDAGCETRSALDKVVRWTTAPSRASTGGYATSV